ncbi:MAG: alkyl/aryl-sulfatase, partial [Phenylobacterium sp.]
MRSFDPDPSVTVAGPEGQRIHRGILEHTQRLARRLYNPRPGVWTLVGNGMSNQSFIEGPGGIIAVDTGESVEEMRAALAELRGHTQAPIVAVLYTHFHYIGGTRAVFEDAGGAVPILGHERIPANLARVSSEIGPAYSRGLIHQFGLRLPPDGPDALANEGLGLFFRDPAHAPFTPGYVAPSEFFKGGERLSLAGLTVEVTNAPSDSDDSVTFWFPELGVSIQNLVWPTLYNIFPIRGEAYRDPQVLLQGIDHLIGLEAEHMLGAHGPPLSGKGEIAARTTLYRDSIQFLWDQTVRGMNRG